MRPGRPNRPNRRRHYKFFFMLNSSARGPFYPSYMPRGWHWLHAYLERFEGDVHAVASSLVCLPEMDAGAWVPWGGGAKLRPHVRHPSVYQGFKVGGFQTLKPHIILKP